jgi:hypothetical protein
MTDKTVITDIQINLCEMTKVECKLNDAYAVRRAVKKDLPLVFEFMGEALIDELGMDVRKLNKEAHEKNCQQLIADGVILIGTHRGKPAFICKISESPIGVFLENPHFPVAMRRPKVMRGIHARIGELLLQEYDAVLTYLDTTAEETQAALEEAGYRIINTSRVMRLR